VTSWLGADELRVGLGCMRLGDEGPATIAAAIDAGMTVFDTARSYERNEELLARALRGVVGARIVTKGGMARPSGTWVPDGRAKSIRADCEASLEALDGLPIDLYLLHVPDPRTPWRTSLRALARLVDDGLVARVGVCNVNRAQLDEAVELAPIAAAQVALSVFDDRALRGGVVDRCAELGIALIAHSPLGGPRRAPRLARHEALPDIAHAHGANEAEVALAWLLGLGPQVVGIPGARRPETARSAARAAALELTDDERSRVRPTRTRPARAAKPGDVVLVMGVPGAGKSRIAAEHVEHGYVRLNRDERGGSLRGIADELDRVLAAGAREVVLDNTYLTRAARHDVVETAARHGVLVRCLWLDVPLAQAQVNLVERLLDRFDELPTPGKLKVVAHSEAGLLTPTQQMRAFRELEPPGDDEGFASVERVPFVPTLGEGRAGAFVAAAAAGGLPLREVDPTAPPLGFAG
jgi:aryl-alcohol dehydrogenase-like predicted oxidoreductase/predicted kinase